MLGVWLRVPREITKWKVYDYFKVSVTDRYSSTPTEIVIPEIYRAEPPRRRECLYYLALGHYKMGNFEEAKKFNGNYSHNDITSPFSLKVRPRFIDGEGAYKHASPKSRDID